MSMIYRIYFDSVKVLWKYRLLYLVPVINSFLFVFAYRANKYHPGLYGFVVDLLTMGIGIALDLLIILTVFKEYGFYPSEVSRWLGVKKFFWRIVGVNVASFFIVLVALSPLCFFLFLLALDEFNNVFSVLFIFTFAVFMVLFFGINSLGIRILVSRDKKITESMWAGFQDLNLHRSYYVPFLAVTILISFFPTLIVNLIGLLQVGSTFYSVPFIPLEAFRENLMLVMESVPNSYAILRLYSLLISPIINAAITLIYLRRPQQQNCQMQISEIVN